LLLKGRIKQKLAGIGGVGPAFNQSIDWQTQKSKLKPLQDVAFSRSELLEGNQRHETNTLYRKSYVFIVKRLLYNFHVILADNRPKINQNSVQ